jgi:hypothetical protein
MFVIAPLVYMLADNTPPYEYDAAKSYVVPSPTPSGQQLTVHWEFKVINRVCIGSVTRVIVDVKTKTRITYDPSSAARTIEFGDKYLDRTFFLPPLITPGEKEYYSEGEYACNPLQKFYPLRVTTPRLTFFVH